MRELDLSTFHVSCERHLRALAVLQRMTLVDDVVYDIFTVDNTNVIESYFSVVKKRLCGTTRTLLDVFNAVDFTETTALARNNCFTARLHPQLRDCLAMVVSPNVLNVLAPAGVNALIGLMVRACVAILNDAVPEDDITRTVSLSIQNGILLDRYSLVPSSWIVPKTWPVVSHEISRIDIAQANGPQDVLLRLEPFLGVAHRSLAVFREINAALTTLYTLKTSCSTKNLMPVNFSFLLREFGHFAMIAETDDEVLCILNELCATLEEIGSKPENGCTTNRPSIVDPNVIAMKGRLATNTSSNVDRASKQPRTKTVNDHQIAALGRERKVRTRRHVCPICCQEGHYAKTCRDVLSDEHAVRAEGFLKRLIENNATEQYTRAMSARVSPEFASEIAARIRAVEESMHGVCPVPSSGTS